MVKKEGYLVDDPHSIKGINYKNDIVSTLRNGVLPAAMLMKEELLILQLNFTIKIQMISIY